MIAIVFYSYFYEEEKFWKDKKKKDRKFSIFDRNFPLSGGKKLFFGKRENLNGIIERELPAMADSVYCNSCFSLTKNKRYSFIKTIFFLLTR